MTGEPASFHRPAPARLILFTRWPAPGQAKTRLIPALGPEGAALLHAALTQRALAWCLALIRQHPALLELRCVGAPAAAFRRWLGWAPLIRPQAEGDLGARMHQALSEALAEGADRVVLMGSDCPGLTDAVLAQAFAALHDHDLVLGPATDGGYYLVGLTRPAPELFADITWGTERVLEQTLAAARRAGL
ncbi:MAG: TIGR04282 family arsenosugar biosynthesis glycosyltransferase, partial [Pseudomonadota bacterium]